MEIGTICGYATNLSLKHYHNVKQLKQIKAGEARIKYHPREAKGAPFVENYEGLSTSKIDANLH